MEDLLFIMKLYLMAFKKEIGLSIQRYEIGVNNNVKIKKLPWSGKYNIHKINDWRKRELEILEPSMKNRITGLLTAEHIKATNKIHWEIHRKIKYIKDDIKWYKKDHWQTSDNTFRTETGDCEDQAFARMALMRLAKIPDCYLGIVITQRHALAILYKNINADDFYLLDNGNTCYSMQHASKVFPYIKDKKYPLFGFNLFDQWEYGYYL